MYIEDDQWDRLIGDSCDLVTSISHLAFPKTSVGNEELLKRKNLFYDCSGMLQSFINLNEQPIMLSQIKNVEESRYFIFKWAIKQIFRIKRNSRSCSKSR